MQTQSVITNASPLPHYALVCPDTTTAELLGDLFFFLPPPPCQLAALSSEMQANLALSCSQEGTCMCSCFDADGSTTRNTNLVSLSQVADASDEGER